VPGHQQRPQLGPDPLQALFVASLRPVRAKLGAPTRKRAHEPHDKHHCDHDEQPERNEHGNRHVKPPVRLLAAAPVLGEPAERTRAAQRRRLGQR
jgi:hypothetical protein